MREILMMILLFTVQMIFFYCTGSCICHFAKPQKTSVGLTFLMGFCGVFALFELISLPFILLKQTLYALSCTWMLLMGGICLLSLILCRKDWVYGLRSIPVKLERNSVLLLLPVLTLLAQLFLVLTHNDRTVDASYYIGKVTTDVYHNSLGLVDPYTGNALKAFNVRYLFSTFPDYNAVFSYVFDVHPMLQAKTVVPVLVIFALTALYYQFGLFLFQRDRKKTSVFIWFLFLINLYSNTLYTSSAFLLTRTYEGKAILAAFILPAILLGLLFLYRGIQKSFAKWFLLLASISSTTFSSSSMLIVPLALGAGFVILSIRKRTLRYFGWFFLYMLPNVLVAVFYFLHEAGILAFQI